MTFLQFQKELYYISEGIILKNSQKDLRRCEGFQKVLYSAWMEMTDEEHGRSLWVVSLYNNKVMLSDWPKNVIYLQIFWSIVWRKYVETEKVKNVRASQGKEMICEINFSSIQNTICIVLRMSSHPFSSFTYTLLKNFWCSECKIYIWKYELLEKDKSYTIICSKSKSASFSVCLYFEQISLQHFCIFTITTKKAYIQKQKSLGSHLDRGDYLQDLMAHT